MMIDSPVYYGEMKRYVDPLTNTVNELLGVVKEMTACNVELVQEVDKLRQDHERLRRRFDGLQEVNNLWDGS